MQLTAPVHDVTQPLPGGPEISDIIRLFGEQYSEKHPVTTQQAKAMRDIELCRTSALGGHVDVCDNGCGYMRISYNSCRNRHCPKCQGLQSAKWLEKQQNTILPTPYFHVIVTFPHELNNLILANQTDLYNIAFRSSARSLFQLAKDWKGLKAQVGITAILHTWNQDLDFHPHIHMIVTAGGLDESSTRWLKSRDNFLVPVGALSAKVRGKFLHHLRRTYDKGKLRFPKSMEDLRDPCAFRHFVGKLFDKSWGTFSQAPSSDDPYRALKYLSQYTHRVAISNQRLVSVDDGQVTFTARDNDNRHKKRLVTLPWEEFIRRFLLHVLPSGFTKIRHYGLMAPRNRKTKLMTARKLLQEAAAPAAGTPGTSPTDSPCQTWQELFRRITGVDLTLCPSCRKGKLIRQPLSLLDQQTTSPFAVPILEPP